ncbi:hypothetical protein [Listeria booriae]|uniref:Uncharacterized protein n=1 Tax=Listeria booriae TaxID=1552123 RepID=A0A7X1DSN3_9LIST|nr:hypothetical protein [Listeria booriae]MBC1318489.1 hypothetical protein [Listeria booriae]MBC2373750.1 hypothetical protein [Listeria booriae]MBC2388798.1 hypothetical protein [Listeria booriae]
MENEKREEVSTTGWEEKKHTGRKLNGYEKVRNEILRKLEQKKYIVGSQLFYHDLKEHAENKTNYQRALYYLEGAGIIVNEVIITDKIPKELMQRVGLAHE